MKNIRKIAYIQSLAVILKKTITDIIWQADKRQIQE